MMYSKLPLDQCEKSLSFSLVRHAVTLPIISNPDVSIDPGRVLVKVQEGVVLQIEHADLSLLEWFQLPQLG
jgi:hypothetical protein